MNHNLPSAMLWYVGDLKELDQEFTKAIERFKIRLEELPRFFHASEEVVNSMGNKHGLRVLVDPQITAHHFIISKVKDLY